MTEIVTKAMMDVSHELEPLIYGDHFHDELCDWEGLGPVC